jgi:hypothetical protein
MLRIITPDPLPAEAPFEEASVRHNGDAAEDYEIVVGRRHIASLSLVVVVLIAVCSGASYIAGKAAGVRQPAPKTAAQASEVPSPPTVSQSAEAEPEPTATAEQLAAALTALAPALAAHAQSQPVVNMTAKPPADESEAALFEDPIPGAVYIQIGAVDRGVGMILAEGLRSRGFHGFVAPGPSEKIFRVLVGPFRNQEEYQASKAAVDKVGLAAFTRKYSQSETGVAKSGDTARSSERVPQ